MKRRKPFTRQNKRLFWNITDSMENRHCILKTSGPVFYHRGDLRTLFNQIGVFLRDAVQFSHRAG